jgi:predicted  nucleic acid-binding Zn-ribbon protein
MIWRRRTAKFDELKNRTRKIEADRKKIDLDVQSKQVAISRYKSQQQQTRKNEEFAALNHEIEHAEKEISALEDKELELMEAYDKGLAAVAAAQKELVLFQDKAKHKKADLEKRSATVSAELIGAEEKQAAAETDRAGGCPAALSPDSQKQKGCRHRADSTAAPAAAAT